MRALVVLGLLVGCTTPRQHCYELSTSPDGRYRLDAHSETAWCSPERRRDRGFVVLRDLTSGDMIDYVRTDSLDLRREPFWSPSAVTFDIRERGIWETMSIETTLRLPEE